MYHQYHAKQLQEKYTCRCSPAPAKRANAAWEKNNNRIPNRHSKSSSIFAGSKSNRFHGHCLWTSAANLGFFLENDVTVLQLQILMETDLVSYLKAGQTIYQGISEYRKCRRCNCILEKGGEWHWVNTAAGQMKEKERISSSHKTAGFLIFMANTNTSLHLHALWPRASFHISWD